MEQYATTRRLAALRAYLAETGLDGALLTSYENRRYFCGFTGSSGYLLVTADGARLVTDKRYTTQAEEEAKGCAVIEHGADRLGAVARAVNEAGAGKLALEASLPVGEYTALAKELPQVELRLEGQRFLEMRMVKDEEELGNIRRAIAAAEAGFEKLLPRLKIGMTEKDLANELHYLLSKEGAETMSFGTIVASGPRGALAHGVPTDKVIGNGDMVVVDFGVKWNGYCSDMTRTLLFGDIAAEDMRVFKLVEESLQAARAAVRPGVTAAEVEAAHRAPFLREGLNGYTLAGLGHGIGLEIHECPRMVPQNGTVLRPGMVFTIEPGLYFPGRCGVRTEDDVLVTATGVEDLSRTPYEIHIG